MTSVVSAPSINGGIQKKPKFYRPELDALRFFAFFCVFIHHGPELHPVANAPLWKIYAANTFMLIRDVGGFGMGVFFLLSSYLITELLSRERLKTGQVHLKAFCWRRILRIWPLYYVGVFLAILLGHFIPDPFWVDTRQKIGFLAFAVAWVGSHRFNPFMVLWSIGVEEQFYLIWPLLAKLGGAVLIRRASYVVIFVSFCAMVFFSGSHLPLWFNPLVEFLFFAAGALLSISLHGQVFTTKTITRCLLFATGFLLWLAAQSFGGIVSLHTPSNPIQNCIGYALAAMGTTLMFVSVLGAAPQYIPSWLIYLGRISYGLYVFHFAVMLLVERWLPSISYPALWIACVDVISLVATTLIASLSFHYFEAYFIRLKGQFEFIKSR